MSGEKTEKATEQKKKKARDKGDSVRSRELISALAMLGGLLVLGGGAHRFAVLWAAAYAEMLQFAARPTLTPEAMSDAMRKILFPALAPVGMVMVGAFAAAVMAGVAQSNGLQFHVEAIAIKGSRLNPGSNLKQVLSLRSVTRLAKSLIPAAAVLMMAIAATKQLLLPMPVMSLQRLPEMLSSSYGLVLNAAWVMLAWAGLDYAMEWRQWNEKLKMSKQDIREEMRDSSGNPQIKGKLRQMQRAMRRRKAKVDMSRASVVITNPTHYAVVLEFSFETMQAPKVLGKGRDLHALDIREEAKWAGVPIVENAPLARSLYRAVEPGQSIPYDLYAAVAGILAYLYRQKMEEAKRRQEHRERSAGAARSASAYGGAQVMQPRTLLPVLEIQDEMKAVEGPR